MTETVATNVAATTTEIKTTKTSPKDRKYVFLAAPKESPKGKQRQIVLRILLEAKEPMTAHEAAKLAGPLGLTAAAGVEASVGWHLHQMTLLGIAKVVNPTTFEQPTATDGEVAEAQTMLMASGD